MGFESVRALRKLVGAGQGEGGGVGKGLEVEMWRHDFLCFFFP